MTFSPLSLQEQRAQDYVARHAQLGSFTLAELAHEYGISKAAARQVLRLADADLASQSMATSVPNRASGWRQSATADARRYAASWRERFRAMGTEVSRCESGLRAVNADPSVLLAVSDIRVSVETLAEALANLANPGGATGP